ncbi:TPA: restriction endonuclease subunit S [Enterobacter hormaechei subsp. xiangfangensis]|nr:restriction endonuclease subunit S [Enterobacter hormaechei subsp. xiangfangensis]
MNCTVKMQAEKKIPDGYKLTEAGMIPEDWEIRKIGDIAEVIRGASPRPKGDKRFYGGNIPRLMVEDVTRDGKYVTPSVDSLTEAGAKLSRPCDKGTLTLVCSGTVGVPSILAIDACIHDGFLALSKVNKSISIDYLYHFFTTQQDKFNNSATHGGIFTNLTTDGVREFLLALPRNKNEQTAIASFLSDIDTSITALEQLITKKQDVKIATMQQLLTGRSRLPQFAKHPDGTTKGYKTSEVGQIPEDWNTVSIYELADKQKAKFDDGDWIESEHITDKGIRLIQTGNIGVGQFLDKESKKYISETSFEQLRCKELQIGDLLICRLAEPAGRACIFPDISESKVITSIDVTIFRPDNNRANRQFLSQYFSSSEWFKNVHEQVGGTTHKRISRGALGKIIVPYPTVKEQTAIATILSDMDAELEALEQKLAKFRDIKQGMMQQLLTGRIRLPLAHQP